MDGWGKGRWANGQILIYENKKSKGGRGRKQQVCNPFHAMNERGKGSKCSSVWLEFPEAGRDAIRSHPRGRSRAFQFARLIIVVRRWRREPPFVGLSLFFRCGTHHFRGRRLGQPSRFRRNQWRRGLDPVRHTSRRRCGKSWQRRNRRCWCIWPDGRRAKRRGMGTRRDRSRRLRPSRTGSVGPRGSRPRRVRARRQWGGSMGSRGKMRWRWSVRSCGSYRRSRRRRSWGHRGGPRMHGIESWQRGLCRRVGAVRRGWRWWWDWCRRRRQHSLRLGGCYTESRRQRL